MIELLATPLGGNAFGNALSNWMQGFDPKRRERIQKKWDARKEKRFLRDNVKLNSKESKKRKM